MTVSCSSGNYFDPITGQCHSCDECSPGRTITPSDYCRKSCKEFTCKELEYYDPATDRCHPCSDCSPPRPPVLVCTERCNRYPLTSTLSTANYSSTPPIDSTTTILIVCSVVSCLIVAIIVAISVYWHLTRRTGRTQPRNIYHTTPAEDEPGRNGQFTTVTNHTPLTTSADLHETCVQSTAGTNHIPLMASADPHETCVVAQNCEDHSFQSSMFVRNESDSHSESMNGRSVASSQHRVSFAEDTECRLFRGNPDADSELTEHSDGEPVVTQPVNDDSTYYLMPSVRTSYHAYPSLNGGMLT